MIILNDSDRQSLLVLHKILLLLVGKGHVWGTERSV
nr:MAG TPA: hypothetical protein [Caudoviricetes sp.]